MLSSKGLKEIVSIVRPIIERQLDDAEQIAAFRDKVADSGGDWSALKALIKAQIQDERDETGDGKRVKKILEKAGFSTGYADMLGWSNMNEKNFSAEEDYDQETGEVFGNDVSAKLVATVATGMQTEIGRKALVTALDIMIEREEAEERRSDGGLSILTKHEDIRTAPVTAEETHERPSTNDEPSPEAGPQAEASPAGTGAGTLADREGRHDGEAVSADLPTHSEKATVATQGEATEPTSAEREDRAAANAGGDDVDGGALRAKPLVTGVGAANSALPANGATLEYVPASGVKRLPFAHCFPEVSKADYERLERDIAANRVQTPIIRRDDVIIDGWARYMISRQYGMSYPVVEYTGCDILLDVIELQRAARNFSPAQEKKIAADLAKVMPDRADDIMAAFGLAEALEAAE